VTDFITEHNLFKQDFRAFIPSDSGSEEGMHGKLAENSRGDGYWKPRRVLFITGPVCTCTLNAPVGTACERHSTYKSPTKNPRQTMVYWDALRARGNAT